MERHIRGCAFASFVGGECFFLSGLGKFRGMAQCLGLIAATLAPTTEWMIFLAVMLRISTRHHGVSRGGALGIGPPLHGRGRFGPTVAKEVAASLGIS